MNTFKNVDFQNKQNRAKEILNNNNYQELEQKNISQNVLLYNLDNNNEHKNQVFAIDPHTRIQSNSIGMPTKRDSLDTYAMLRNLNTKNTKDLNNNLDNNKKSEILNLPDGFIEREHTRLNNCNLDVKSAMPNIWYPLHIDPQENCIEPFSRIGKNTYLNTIDTHKNC